MNPSQYEAFKTALTSNVGLIQGPPGTGKTFVGLNIVQVLLANLPREKKPLLIICQTNHALDKFLEGTLQFTSKVMRVGGYSKSDVLKRLNLRGEYYSNLRRTAGIHQNEGSKEWCLDVRVMKNVDVIGMTTTCAARMHNVLEGVQPAVVIVEEAADIFEAHIVSSLTISCEQLILIGDHKQLRPLIATTRLGSPFHNLDISLFERLINNGIHCPMLNIQYRMHPDISSLISFIYPNLQNHESVRKYKAIKGVRKNAFFLKHRNYEEEEEDVDDSTSKINRYEVDFLVELYRYLLNQGYSSSQITILTPYAAQVQLFRKVAQKHKKLATVKCVTVDAYQGVQNDIILLSLVRSRRSNEVNIGFLDDDNRLCVALSHAKKGLFIIGNINFLSGNNSSWQKIKETLQQQGNIGDEMTLYCEEHKSSTLITSPDDFEKVGYGNCSKMKEGSLVCKLIRHSKKEHTSAPSNKSHIESCSHERGKQQANCQILIVKTRQTCGHRISLPCNQKIISTPCEEWVEKTLSCGHRERCLCKEDTSHVPCLESVKINLECGLHQKVVPCYQKMVSITCKELVKKILPCGHENISPCYRQKELLPCKEWVEKTFSCGHQKRYLCKESASHVRCLESVKVNLNCGLHQKVVPCYRKILVSITCGEFVKKILPCGHENISFCYQQKELLPCEKWVEKTLSCGHRERCLCKEDTSHVRCLKSVKIDLECGLHQKVVPCYQKMVSITCKELVKKILPCGHENISPCYRQKELLPCKEWVEKTFSCGHQKRYLCKESASHVRCLESVKVNLNCGLHQKVVPCYRKILVSITCGEFVKKILPCGHENISFCYQQKELLPCEKWVEKTLSCGHRERCLCKEDTSHVRCLKSVKIDLECGLHQKVVPCYQKMVSITCKELVKKILPCGHENISPCYRQKELLPCKEWVEKTFSCGHQKRYLCKESASHVRCLESVKVNLNCGLHQKVVPCYRKILVSITCGEFVKKILPCGHENISFCYQQKELLPCEKWVEKTLSCGHRERCLCKEDTSHVRCLKSVKIDLKCGLHQKVVPCYQKMASITCEELITKILPCGHENISPCYRQKELLPCEKWVEKTLSCGHRERCLCKEDTSYMRCSKFVTIDRNCGLHQDEVPCYEINCPMNSVLESQRPDDGLIRHCTECYFSCGHKQNTFYQKIICSRSCKVCSIARIKGSVSCVFKVLFCCCCSGNPHNT